jgi:hypothetical protein
MYHFIIQIVFRIKNFTIEKIKIDKDLLPLISVLVGAVIVWITVVIVLNHLAG